MDGTGKLVKQINVTDDQNFQISSFSNFQIEIERGDLNSGVYFVELTGNRKYRGKLIIE